MCTKSWERISSVLLLSYDIFHTQHSFHSTKLFQHKRARTCLQCSLAFVKFPASLLNPFYHSQHLLGQLQNSLPPANFLPTFQVLTPSTEFLSATDNLFVCHTSRLLAFENSSLLASFKSSAQLVSRACSTSGIAPKPLVRAVASYALQPKTAAATSDLLHIC